LYLIESFELIIGIDALFFFKELIKLFKSLIVKFGLAASCIKTLFGLNFLIYLNPIRDESDLSLPPLMIITFLGYLYLICFLSFITKIIFLNSFESNAFSKECSKRALFLYLINCLGFAN